MCHTASSGVTNTNICCSPESPCSLYAYGCGLIAPKLQRPIGLARERHEAGWLVYQLVEHAFKIKWEPPPFTVMNPPTPEDQVDNNFVLRGEFQVLGFCLPAYVAFKDFHARADPTVMQQLNTCIGAESDRPPVQVAAAAASRPGSRSPRRRVTPWVRVRPNDVAIDVEDSPAKASASASATVSATVPDYVLVTG